MDAVVALILLTTFATGQGLPQSLYARGLQACLDKEADFLKSATGQQSNVTISSDDTITRELPKQFGQMTVEYLDDRELAAKYLNTPRSERGEGIPVIKIFPIYDKDEKLFFAFSNYSFSYSEKGGLFSRKRYIYGWALGGGCHAEIAFDAASQRFIIKQVELWGV